MVMVIKVYTYTQTQCHGDAEPLPASLTLSHQQRDLFESANVGLSIVLFSCFEFKAGLSYSELLLKDPRSNLQGP